MSTRVMTGVAVAFAVIGGALLLWPRASTPHAEAPVVAATASHPTQRALPAPPSPVPSTTPSPAPVPPTSTPSPSPSTSSPSDDVDLPAPTPPATDEDAAALAAARRIAQAYARPAASMTQAQWWARLEPLLSDQARSDYRYVQGHKVPFTRVIADPILDTPAEGEDSHLSSTALVPTDAGTYEIELIAADGKTWSATRITPLEDLE